MASTALTTWRTTRWEALEQLVAAHGALGGAGPGRRWATEQLNRALFLALASEYQGFCRDMHIETAAVLSDWASPLNTRIATVIATGISSNLKLSSSNARRDNLRDDFVRFGIDFWGELQAHDSRTGSRRKKLETLNEVRNALAHSDDKKLATVLTRETVRLDLATFRRWRTAAGCIAGTMDLVLAKQLARLFNRNRPW